MSGQIQSPPNIIDNLVDGLDDLPRIMSEINTKGSENDNAYANYEPKLNNYEAYTLPEQDITKQASRVMDSLLRIKAKPSYLSHNPKPIVQNEKPVYISELSKKALKSIEDLSHDPDIDLNKVYKSYDTHRRGMISYDDFADILIHNNSGISKDAAKLIAKEIDTTKAGLVEYGNIIDNLHRTIEKHGQISKKVILPDQTKYIQSNSADSLINSISNEPLKSSESNSIIDVKILEPSFNPTPSPKRASDLVSQEVKAVVQNQQLQSIPGPVDPPTYNIRRHFNSTTTLPYALDFEKSLQPKSRPGITIRRHELESTSLLKQIISGEIATDTTTKMPKHYDSSMIETKNKLSLYLNKLSAKQLPSPMKDQELKDSTTVSEKSNVKALPHRTKLPPEVSTANQLTSSINRLRHELKSIDRSKSGYVNYNEFQAALTKLGIHLDHDDQVQLFMKNSVKSSTTKDVGIGYTNGLAVDIDEFMHNIQTISSAPILSSSRKTIGASNTKYQRNYNDKICEERRTLRHILRGLNRVSDPLAVFQQHDKHHNGWIRPEHLRQGLADMGIQLTNHEYDLVMHAVDVNHENKVDLMKFKDVLDEKVNQYDREQVSSQQKELHSHPGYSASYKTSNSITEHKSSEYDLSNFNRSRTLRQQNLKWTKLKEYIISNKDKVLSSFTSKSSVTPGEGTLDELSYSDLIKRFERQGVRLGQDDKETLQLHLKRFITSKDNTSPRDNGLKQAFELQSLGNAISVVDNDNPRITVNAFCETVGLGVTQSGDKTVLLDRRDFTEDGGIFASSKHQLSHPGSSSTINLEIPNFLDDPDRRGRRKHRGPVLPHTYEPSKFWEMGHAEKDILIPMPLMSYRDPTIPTLRERQYALSKSRYTEVQPTTKRISKGVDIAASKSQMQQVLEGKAESPKRSKSAPPRTGVPYVNIDTVNRWGTQTLADFAKLRNIDTHNLSGTDMNIISNKSLDSSVMSMALEDYRTKFGTADTAIGMKSRTLRKQYRTEGSSEPPFALGY